MPIGACLRLSLPRIQFLSRRAIHRQMPTTMKIELTEIENQFCTLLDACCADLEANQGISTTCRIAGGWVRDKLLGKQSNDIDVALSSMMGDVFATHLAAFAETKNVKTGAIAVINPNPEQSKHLQTARIPIFGLDVDLVNLRSEEYANEDSRIPTAITFGTPLEDAMRRDITINAMFYNIHTREVEDCTEKGLDDLQNGIIRTPLPPRETFLDDPLRVLRSLRFASRFGFKIVSELEDAVKDPEIQNALVSKVTRERVGEEVSKIMKGPDPTRGIELIHDLSLYDSVFNVLPSEVTLSASLGPAISSVKAARILRSIITPEGSILRGLPAVHPTLVSALTNDSSAIARLFLAGALTPYAGITFLDRKKRTQSAIDCAIRESLRLGTQNHFLDGVPLLFTAAQLLKNPDLERFKSPSQRLALGLLLREKALHQPAAGARWELAVLFSLVQELVPLYDVEADRIDEPDATRLVELYNKFVVRIQELELQDVGELKPLLNGHTVCAALGAAKPGAWTGRVLSQMIEWQLENPRGTEEECKQWLQDEKSAWRVEIDEGNGEPSRKRMKTKP